MMISGKCEKCMPLYNEKKYVSRYASPNAMCYPCSCSKLADSCSYNETIGLYPSIYF